VATTCTPQKRGPILALLNRKGLHASQHVGLGALPTTTDHKHASVLTTAAQAGCGSKHNCKVLTGQLAWQRMGPPSCSVPGLVTRHVMSAQISRSAVVNVLSWLSLQAQDNSRTSHSWTAGSTAHDMPICQPHEASTVWITSRQKPRRAVMGWLSSQVVSTVS
jgi:hypothetical protein